jgi:hypothetical protein
VWFVVWWWSFVVVVVVLLLVREDIALMAMWKSRVEELWTRKFLLLFSARNVVRGTCHASAAMQCYGGCRDTWELMQLCEYFVRGGRRKLTMNFLKSTCT